MPKSPLPRARFSFSPTVRALLLATACGLALPALAAVEHDEVDRLMQAGKLDEAMSRADAFLKDKPKDPQMRFLKGVIQLDTGKRAEAIAAFTQLTQDAPELPEPYNNLAVIYASQNQFDRARSALESAIRTNPSYATAQENLGDVYARLASQAYSKALQLDQNNTAVQPKLAVIRTLFTPAPVGGKSAATAVAAAPAAKTAAPAPATAPAPVAKAAAAPTPSPAPAPAPAPAPVKAAAAPAPVAAPTPVPPAPPPVVVAKAPEASMPSASASTPASAPAAAAATATPGSTAEVESAVRGWAAAWASQDMERYLGAYGPEFNPGGGQSRKSWEEERRARIVGKSSISVNLENLAINVNGQTATAKFRQIYRADNLNISSRKTLELHRSGNQWQIRKESVGG
jgi:tetratricopeptide (TPR) repeat protein